MGAPHVIKHGGIEERRHVHAGRPGVAAIFGHRNHVIMRADEIAARAVGIPAVSTRRMDRRVRAGMRTRFLYRSLLQRTAAISPAVRALLIEAGVPAERIEVIVDAVDFLMQGF